MRYSGKKQGILNKRAILDNKRAILGIKGYF